MDRGLYPTYFMHMEREDGKRVSVCPGPRLNSLDHLLNGRK